MAADRPATAGSDSHRSATQRRAFGEFIRAQRERLVPAALGLPAGTRRRTPGLRREELAQLCGLSTTWFTWIEQGRDISVSPQALARLAVALRLDRAERAYLFDLAGKRDPARGAAEDEELPAAALRCVDRITVPAYVLDRLWNARAFNKKAEHLFAGWLDQPGERNLLRFIFCAPEARRLIRDWEVRARRIAAEFRATSAASLDDPALRALIGSLRGQSRDFGDIFDRHAVLGREGGERTFDHPADGYLRFEQVTFDLSGHPDFKLTMLLPRT
jgi:transcriptional regulator with XRE-family HTH domain